MIDDYRDAALEPADRALCDFAVKLTLTPGAMSEADVETLRGHGLTDEAIHIAVQVIGYFNYINRIADALGVDPEEWMTPSPEQWRARKGKWPAPCAPMLQDEGASGGGSDPKLGPTSP